MKLELHFEANRLAQTQARQRVRALGLELAADGRTIERASIANVDGGEKAIDAAIRATGGASGVISRQALALLDRVGSPGRVEISISESASNDVRAASLAMKLLTSAMKKTIVRDDFTTLGFEGAISRAKHVGVELAKYLAPDADLSRVEPGALDELLDCARVVADTGATYLEKASIARASAIACEGVSSQRLSGDSAAGSRMSLLASEEVIGRMRQIADAIGAANLKDHPAARLANELSGGRLSWKETLELSAAIARVQERTSLSDADITRALAPWSSGAGRPKDRALDLDSTIDALIERGVDEIAKPRIKGVLETSLYTDDLPRLKNFYRDLFGFEDVEGNDRIAVMRIRDGQVLLLFKRDHPGSVTRETSSGVIPGSKDPVGELHLAFQVPASDLEGWKARLQANGVELESTTNWELGGQSIYLRDPDRNSIELVTPGLWPKD